ncbi:MAG: aminotransferase class I/II-fold pyridoxal phosphate-dependent enzyme [Blastocatellia bacterium]
MKRSAYIAWAKYHASARYNLANSGILGCDLGDLTLTMDDVAINGPNHEGFAPLKEAIAARYGTTADRVVTAQGTSMANFLAMATVIERGDEVLVEHPVYDPILSTATYLGAEVKRFHRRFENSYQVDLDELKRLVSPHTRLIVLTSPHNPSGVAVEPSALEQIAELAASAGARVLVDEVYRDILFEDAPPSTVHLGPHFIATSSLTKSYGLNGLRCGWILCDPEMAERMRRMNDLFGSVGSVPSDTLSVAAFRQLDRLLARTRSLIEPNTTLVHRFLGEHEDLLDCVVPPRSTIVFPRLKHHDDSQPVHDALRKLETSIVPGRFFEAPRHFRLGFAVETADVATGLEHLSKAMRLIE